MTREHSGVGARGTSVLSRRGKNGGRRPEPPRPRGDDGEPPLEVAPARATAPISSIMSTRVLAVFAQTRIEQLILLLINENISGVPVIDEIGRPIGVVSKTDLVADDYDWAERREEAQAWNTSARGVVGASEDLFPEQLFASRVVADIMTSVALCAEESMPIPEVAAMMARHRVHRLPVVDLLGLVVGIVTTFDLTQWVAEQFGLTDAAPPAPPPPSHS